MKKISILILALAFTQLLNAQYLKENVSVGAGLGFGSVVAPSLHLTKVHSFGDKKNFRVGYGLRWTSTFGSKVDYQTAPAKFTTGKTGLAAFVSELIPTNIDTVQLGKVQTNSLNLYLSLEHAIYKRFSAAFNVDLVGFSFGSNQVATLGNRSENAKVSAFNALLVGDNDLGSLNSEILLKYAVCNKWTAQVGFGFLFTEYTTDGKFKLDNTRFRNKGGMVTIGGAYTFGRDYCQKPAE